MKKIEWKFVEDRVLDKDELRTIVELKDQHWTHGYKSQVKWIEDNINPDDVHLLGISDDDCGLCAYLSLVYVNVTIDGNSKELIGLGNVCVDKALRRSGIGRLLVEKAISFLSDNSCAGILLCKKELVGFYEKTGWVAVEYTKAMVCGSTYTGEIMFFGHDVCDIGAIELSRLF